MARFPVIDSSCPYQGNLSAIMDGDFCRACKRSVTDLSAMDDTGRAAFLAACKGEVCVTYAFPRKRAMALAAMAAAVAAMPVAAVAQDAHGATEAEMEDIIIVAGGVRAPNMAEMVSDSVDAALPELPVTYDDEPAPAVPVASK